MALCKFSESFQVFDVTPIENIFIEEFMLKAPSDFVKVYIYGLKQCYQQDSSENTLKSFSKALGIEEDIIENAFRYWERQGILYFKKNEDDFTVEYYNIKDVLYNKGLNKNESMYKYKDFNENLQQIFGSRLLTPQEYLRVYDWIEILNLPMEVVLMMIQLYVSRMGEKLTINYLDKVAQTWAKDEINTLQKAEEYIQSNDSNFKDTVTVLKYLGMNRTPTKAELDLSKKWHYQWGFNLQSILTACKETTKVQRPTFAYLDKILENLYDSGKTTLRQVNEQLDKTDDAYSNIKDVYRNLGYKNYTPNPEHLSIYDKWTKEYSLPHNVIIEACRQCVRQKYTSFEDLDNILKEWSELGLSSETEVKDHLDKEKFIKNEIKAVLDRAGESHSPKLSDQRLYKKWTADWNMPFEVILQAAEYSVMAKKKMPFLNKILENWYKAGINTLQDAKADHERHLSAAQQQSSDAPSSKKQVDFNKFSQRNYTKEDLEHLYEDIE